MSFTKANEPAEEPYIVGVIAVLATQNFNRHLFAITIARVCAQFVFFDMAEQHVLVSNCGKA